MADKKHIHFGIAQAVKGPEDDNMGVARDNDQQVDVVFDDMAANRKVYFCSISFDDLII